MPLKSLAESQTFDSFLQITLTLLLKGRKTGKNLEESETVYLISNSLLLRKRKTDEVAKKLNVQNRIGSLEKKNRKKSIKLFDWSFDAKR